MYTVAPRLSLLFVTPTLCVHECLYPPHSLSHTLSGSVSHSVCVRAPVRPSKRAYISMFVCKFACESVSVRARARVYGCIRKMKRLPSIMLFLHTHKPH